MWRACSVAVAAAITLLVIAATATPGLHDGPVYSVDQVLAGIRQVPRQWLGRTVRVRGVALSAIYDGAHPVMTGLSAPDNSTIVTPPVLPIVPRLSATWLTTVRRVPFVGRLLPKRQAPDLWHVAVYRIRLIRSSACPSATTPVCDAGQLVDTMG